jgi:hypothetical protein
MDTDLNNFWVFRYKDMTSNKNFFADPNKKVILAGFSNGIVYREGHFEFDPNFPRTEVWAYKIVWDKPIKKGDIYKNEWVGVGIKIPTGTLGDANFGAWLADHNSVAESACHVNLFKGNSIYFRVDNTEAAYQEVKSAFADYQAEQVTVVNNKAKSGDSQACTDLIAEARLAIYGVSYDTTMSLEDNKARIDAIITKLDADLETQRAYDASKNALSKSVADATAYYESIKESHPTIANTLNSNINVAKLILNSASPKKEDLDSAKEVLDTALNTAKNAVATGITTISADDDAFSGANIFTIDGRKLDGKPTKKGVYIVNGRKVVIK